MEDEITERLARLETRQETIMSDTSSIKKDLHDHIEEDHRVQKEIIVGS